VRGSTLVSLAACATLLACASIECDALDCSAPAVWIPLPTDVGYAGTAELIVEADGFTAVLTCTVDPSTEWWESPACEHTGDLAEGRLEIQPAIEGDDRIPGFALTWTEAPSRTGEAEVLLKPRLHYTIDDEVFVDEAWLVLIERVGSFECGYCFELATFEPV
jgi:hypothetical protein